MSDSTLDEYRSVRPFLLLGDLFGPNGNAFVIRANVRLSVEDCDDIPDELRRPWYDAFMTELRPLTYPEALDLVRDRFEWADDGLSEDIRFSHRYKQDRLSATGLDPELVDTIIADRKDRGEDPLPFEELCDLAASLARAMKS